MSGSRQTFARRWLTAVIAAFAVTLAFGAVSERAAYAVQPDEILPDAGLEARARGLSAQLRCLVCQNQSIDDSDAPLARDLRILVRERLRAGDSDSAVMAYVVDRYGAFVLLKPPFTASTLLLWLTPLAVLLAAIWLGMKTMRTGRQTAGVGAASAKLSASEEDRLKALLADDEVR